jgi:hypothetical protein
MISPNLTFGLLGGGGGSSASSSSATATATAPSASPSSASAEPVTGPASASGSGSPASALASARATRWVVRRGEAHRESRRNEEATATTCGGGERWERKAWGSTTPEAVAAAEAAAIGWLSWANVSAAEHGTGRRRREGGKASPRREDWGRTLSAYLFVGGAVTLHAGPSFYPGVRAI